MNKHQLKATLGLFKASLVSTLKQPTTIIFSILFPFIFIVVFGLLGGNGTVLNVYITNGSDKQNPVYQALDKIESVKFKEYNSDKIAQSELEIGRLDSIIEITQKDSGRYEVQLKTSAAAPDSGGVVFSILDSISKTINLQTVNIKNPAVNLDHEVVSGRKYRQIDFILPGQLGFALLSSGVFGTSFLLLSLKETLVLKRFFATPIKKGNILIAEGLSKLVFSMLQAVIIIGAGYFLFDFTLVNGFVTLLEMLLLTALGLMTFLGLGFFISSIANDQNTIPIVANIFTLPQFLLAGTFFPVDLFPTWLQPLSRVLPLTYLNDALRLVAFEGKGLTEVLPQIAALVVWIIIVYAITAKTFKWEK